ncbi:SulP family inorganic anion transporter [Sodalis praecaptivus]|uniref:SulP family inorganic anion transporter n=1 Tax=Sodalis praecaptivus TaxID=1239307 RepID=UPI0027EFE812|nr:SulP family inorganic anion transporter [Sodalis praecaptivus]CAJ0990980.1 C4-dicarboxylic acid transporter DauA [Sodalis praecaptivus]
MAKTPFSPAAPGVPRLLARECLAGIVTALALVPEVISFLVTAGVDPKVSLVASIVLCLVTSLLGGRRAMVTAAAGSLALVIGPMVHVHGVAYILPTVLLAGSVQILFGLAGLARMMRYIPRSVMVGFVNALGILIFVAQVPHLLHHAWQVWLLFALTGVIMFAWPRLTSALPSSLVAIVVVTVIAVWGGWPVPTVGDAGPMMAGLPGLTEWRVPLTAETLRIIWPTALSVAFVGLLESLLTAKLVDKLTDSHSSKRRESWALGVANLCAGAYGGIAGCAMIGQTLVNVQLGQARTRLSTFTAALMLLLLVTALSDVMARIPMVVLATVMMIVAVKTVNWHSVNPGTLRKMPFSETLVMSVTVAATVWTGNLAVGVLGGVVLAADGSQVHYRVRGPLFFGSSNDLIERFAYGQDPATVIIDLTHSQIWDASSVAELDAIVTKYQAQGAEVTFTGLDARSSDFHRRLTGRLP